MGAKMYSPDTHVLFSNIGWPIIYEFDCLPTERYHNNKNALIRSQSKPFEGIKAMNNLTMLIGRERYQSLVIDCSIKEANLILFYGHFIVVDFFQIWPFVDERIR